MKILNTFNLRNKIIKSRLKREYCVLRMEIDEF
jgi:hypothetical protein